MKRQMNGLIPTVAVVAMMASTMTLAASGDDVPEALEDLTINGQAITPESVHRVDLEGPIYEVRLRNGDTFYSDAQGRHMVVGNLYDNAPEGLINVTEQRNRQERLDQLQDVSEDGLVTYPARGDDLGEITVFTDTTCPYCQMLHQQIDQLTAAGITVHYVPYPRAGSQSPAARQLAQVMCSESPENAMTSEFKGQSLSVSPSQSCLDVVEDGFQLGQRFGVTGTPTIVLPSGEMGEGFVPAEQIVQAIKGAGA